MLACVSTRVAVAADPERETLTAEGFLEWLQPGRTGAELVEYAAGAPKIESLAVPGFFVLREWLDPDRTPPIADALARVGAPDR